MDDNTPKMLQAILNGQRAIKEELVSKIDKLSQKLDGKIDSLEVRIDNLDQNLNQKIDKLDKKLTKRIDKLGLQLASLEDDTPTREEHDNLVSRVDKLEHQFTSA